MLISYEVPNWNRVVLILSAKERTFWYGATIPLIIYSLEADSYSLVGISDCHAGSAGGLLKCRMVRVKPCVVVAIHPHCRWLYVRGLSFSDFTDDHFLSFTVASVVKLAIALA